MGVMLYESMKRISLLIVLHWFLELSRFSNESRLGKWIDKWKFVNLYIHLRELYYDTSIMLGATKVGEVWASYVFHYCQAYLMLKATKIEALFCI